VYTRELIPLVNKLLYFHIIIEKLSDLITTFLKKTYTFPFQFVYTRELIPLVNKKNEKLSDLIATFLKNIYIPFPVCVHQRTNPFGE
jgi:hypothetical protein